MPTPTRFRESPRTYADADAYLGAKTSRPVANNTRLERRGDDIAVKLHATDVVTFHPDNSRTLTSGGWRTPTTKDRIDGFGLASIGGVTLWQRRGEWLLMARDGTEHHREESPCTAVGCGEPHVSEWDTPRWAVLAPFRDGIRLSGDGRVLNPEPARAVAARERAKAAMLKRIRAYVADYMLEFVKGMPAPGNGDCFYCRGVFGADAERSAEHLSEHMREPYYVPSLAVNAVAARGYRVPAIIVGYDPDANTIGGASRLAMADAVKRALTRYLKSALLPDVASR